MRGVYMFGEREREIEAEVETDFKELADTIVDLNMQERSAF